jgi:cytohesin
MRSDERTRSCSSVALDKGANPNAANDIGETPLLYAADSGHGDTVQILLNNGADPDKESGNEDTPLRLATLRRHIAVVRLLLDKDADFTTYGGDAEISAIGYAMKNDDEPMVRLFLEKITYPKQKVHFLRNLMLTSAVYYGRAALARLVTEKYTWPNVRGRYGSKLLFTAIHYNHKGVVELLLMKGAKLNQKGWYGKEHLISLSIGHPKYHVTTLAYKLNLDKICRIKGKKL